MGNNRPGNDDRLRRLRWCFQPRQWFEGDGEPDPFAINEGDVFMWVYRAFKDDRGVEKFCVGYFMPDGTWFAESEHETRDGAAARVRYLNGGTDTR